MTAAVAVDPIAWVNAQVKAALPESGLFVPAEMAAKVVRALEETDPELFNAWLHEIAVVTLTDRIRVYMRHERWKSRNAAKRGAFDDFVAEHRATGNGPQPQWFQRQCVSDANEWKSEFEFTRVDASFVADGHTQRGNASFMEAAFYKAVAKKLPVGKTVADVFTPETYQAMRASLVR